jgi:hypothetical protein
MNIKPQLVFILLLLLLGCKEKEPQHYYHYFPISDQLKQDGLFSSGSYWIYKNDSTGVVDCTYVEGEPIWGKSQFFPTEYSLTEVETCEMNLQSSIFSNFLLTGNLGDGREKSENAFLTKLNNFWYNCSLGNSTFVEHDDTLSGHTGNNFYICSRQPFFSIGDRYIEPDIYSSLLINDLVVEDVRLTRSIFPLKVSGVDSIDFYFSPGVGIVKLVFRQDTSHSYPINCITNSWSILRYHIAQ